MEEGGGGLKWCLAAARLSDQLRGSPTVWPNLHFLTFGGGKSSSNGGEKASTVKNPQDCCGVPGNWFTELGNALENTGRVLHVQGIVLAESLAQAAPGSEEWAGEGGTHILGWVLPETGNLAPETGLLWKPAASALQTAAA